ncbi:MULTISPECIES: hypothetical protein [unclassified Isoptericola]|uniref:hypothetical protein n=1 Tax=unclassified Isoptericola TaxID=2623355 RepID=UPI00365EE81B
MSLTTLVTALFHPRLAAPEGWPEDTEVTRDDVLVDRTSLARLAEHCATPRVYVPVGADVTRVDRFWGDAEVRTVVLARVVDAVPRLGDDARQAWLDADLGACAVLLDRARLVGRSSAEPLRPFTVHPAPGRGGPAARLPRDLRRGDVLAIPCAGLVDAAGLVR